MISNARAEELLNTLNNQQDILTCSIKEKTTENIYTQTTSLIFSVLPPSIIKYFRDSKIKFFYINKDEAKIRPAPEEFKEAVSYGYSYLKTGEIFLIKPTIVSDIEKLKIIIHHLSHEIGHFVFIFIIGLSYLKQNISDSLQAFFKISDMGGVSGSADKYIKHIYGNYLRKNNKEKLFDIDIKYHENFAEAFRIHIEHKLDSSIEINNKAVGIIDEILGYTV